MARRETDRAAHRSQVLQLIFVHIPKTGGTALREALFRARPWAANLCDYGPANPVTSPLVRELRYGPDGGLPRLGGVLENVPAFSLSGHCKSKPYAGVFGAARLITILRDPVERVISNYRHQLRRRRFSGTVLQFARQVDERNVQARYVGAIGLEQWLFVARQERLGADMKALSQVLGAGITLERVNQAPAEPKLEVGPLERRLILALNELDAELYEAAARLTSCPGRRATGSSLHKSDMQSV